MAYDHLPEPRRPSAARRQESCPVSATASQRQGRPRNVRAAQLRQRRQRQANGAPARRVRRSVPVWTLKGATEFSDDPVLRDPVQVVLLFRQLCPDVCQQLIERTTVVRQPGVAGRNRKPGSWALLFLAQVLTGSPDWEPFWAANGSSAELWQACGFTGGRPSWATFQARFSELEHPRFVSAFTEAAYHFVRVAAAAEPRALRWFQVDGTAANTHSLLEHCCAAHGREQQCRDLPGYKPPKRLHRAWDEEVEADRHTSSREPEPADDAAPPTNRLRKLTDEEAAALGLEWETYRYFIDKGQLLRCRDKQVGVRYYGPRAGARKSKFWAGSYFMPAVCDFFGAPAAVHLFDADIQEHLGFPELDRRLQRALGRKPNGYVFDSAFANERTYKHNTLQGIATIAPNRALPGGAGMETARCDEYDEHGVVRCKYCGGPTVADERTAPFAIQAGDPRLRVRCLLRHTPACESSIQTISCSKQWRVLTPMSRLDARYHDLMRSHKTAEAVFDNWRDRYAVAGTTQATRSKRRNHQAAQELRAASPSGFASACATATSPVTVGTTATSRASATRATSPPASCGSTGARTCSTCPTGPPARRWASSGRTSSQTRRPAPPGGR